MPPDERLDAVEIEAALVLAGEQPRRRPDDLARDRARRQPVPAEDGGDVARAAVAQVPAVERAVQVPHRAHLDVRRLVAGELGEQVAAFAQAADGQRVEVGAAVAVRDVPQHLLHGRRGVGGARRRNEHALLDGRRQLIERGVQAAEQLAQRLALGERQLQPAAPAAPDPRVQDVTAAGGGDQRPAAARRHRREHREARGVERGRDAVPEQHAAPVGPLVLLEEVGVAGSVDPPAPGTVPGAQQRDAGGRADLPAPQQPRRRLGAALADAAPAFTVRAV
ncbi:hypothetical protein LUX33_50810 [Actinomadura madurae]|nr:hypothetical protein [Actinomadura madurae]MCP9955822.1 hypothetical protein [Actinomadura madurae]